MSQVQKARIIDLMQIPKEQHDLDWLKNSLNAAIELELSTLPPYLCAMWSIKDNSSIAYQLIDSIVLEEMLHMGLVCNMLTSIGGTPQINTAIPTYPGPLPGGVRPQLIVYLAGLTTDYLSDVCMQIEYPESGPVRLHLGNTYPTIGAFYDAIAQAFAQVNPTFTGQNQIVTTIGSNQPYNQLYAITSQALAQQAIKEIKEQGEGTSTSPDAVDFGGELAHYYKFAEIYHGKELIQQDGKWVYEGSPIPFPDTYPMAKVPAGGWPNPPENVQTLLTQFNQTFKTLLDQLESAWSPGGSIGAAIGTMFQLAGPAIQLMQIAISPQSDISPNPTYGPDFIVN